MRVCLFLTSGHFANPKKVRAFKFETQQVDQFRRIPDSRFRNQDSFLTFFRKNITYVLSRLPCVEGAFEAVTVAPWRLQCFKVPSS